MTDHKISTSLLEDRFDMIPVKRGKGNSENSSLPVQLEISSGEWICNYKLIVLIFYGLFS